MLGGVAAIVARVAALVEVWWASGRRSSFDGAETLVISVAITALIAGSVVVVEVGRARAAIGPTFTSVAQPALFDAERPVPSTVEPVPSTGTVRTTTTTVVAGSVVPPREVPEMIVVTTTSTLPPKPFRPDSGVAAAELADVTTVLLLGGDAGPGRSGLRTDTMMLFSLHRTSGRAALVSIPRNLERLLFPPGSAMEARYPFGYTDIANAVYPTVSSRASLRDGYDDVDGVRPGVVAIAQGIGYSLDVTIHDYVLVDMQGFLDLIDALGGVTVNVTKAIPMPGNVPGAAHAVPGRDRSRPRGDGRFDRARVRQEPQGRQRLPARPPTT